MMTGRIAFILAIIMTLFFMTTGHSGFADDDEKAPPKKIIKRADVTKAKTEDVLTRAVVWARKVGGDHKAFDRATVSETQIGDNEALLVTIEFSNGDVGLYQGGADPADDKTFILAKQDLTVVEDVIGRAKIR
jgi:hypothetical protein